MFYFEFSFTIFLLMFLPLFSKVISNILKIYELSKIYKILKKKEKSQYSSNRSILCHDFTWLLNFIENVHLGAKDSFSTKLKKILVKIFF